MEGVGGHPNVFLMSFEVGVARSIYLESGRAWSSSIHLSSFIFTEKESNRYRYIKSVTLISCFGGLQKRGVPPLIHIYVYINVYIYIYV